MLNHKCRSVLSLVAFGWALSLPGALVAQPGPQLLGGFDTNGPVDANDVVVDGNYAYLVADNSANGTSPEFFIFNIANPGSPLLLGALDIGSSVLKVRVADKYAFLSTRSDSEEIVVLNISVKSNPQKIATLNLPGSSDAISLDLLDLGYRNRTLFAGTVASGANPELYVIDVDEPTSPVVRATFEVGADVNAIKAEGTFLHLATSKSNKEYSVLDVSLAAAGTVQERYGYDLPGAATAVDAVNGKVFVATVNSGAQSDFFAFNFSAAGGSLLGSIDLQSSHTAVSLFYARAYVTSQDAGKQLQVVNIANPASMSEVSRYSASDRVFSTFASGSRAYLATANNTKEFQIVETGSPLPPVASASTRPNIIMIFSDDHRWDAIQEMPTIMNEFVARGITFRNGFVTTAVCGPSRANLLTGQYPHNHGVKGNRAPEGGVSAFNDTNTIATQLKQAGYRTSYVGKYLNEYDSIAPYTPPGWDNWIAHSDSEGFGRFYYDYTLSENGTLVSYGSTPADYATDVLRDKARDFIQASGSQPFFLVFAPYAPHGPSTPAPRHDGMFSAITPYRALNWEEADILDKPNLFGAFKGLWERNADTLIIPRIDDFGRDIPESLQALDEAVAGILAAVDATGKKNDTLIIFHGDNGLNLGEHWQQPGKACGYEECIRTPFLVRYPALIKTPRYEDRLVATIDLAPTFTDLAGLGALSSHRGRSLVNLLKGTENNWRSEVLIENWNPPSQSQYRPSMTVRSGRWKYIRTYLGDFEELYDLDSDPYELTSVSSVAANAPILDYMRTRLAEMQAE